MNKIIKQPKNKFLKYLFAFCGIISLTLGVIGIFIPLLPTTAFLLLSAALFMKSSTRLYNWLMNHKYLGEYLQNYIHHKTISVQSKITTISLLWITILASVLLILDNLFLKILLLVIAIAVSIHILSFKSHKQE